MDIKTVPLSQLEADPQGTLRDCVNSGQAYIIMLPDQRLVAIQGLEPSEDDSLTNDIIDANSAFKAMIEKSKASPRKPFQTDSQG